MKVIDLGKDTIKEHEEKLAVDCFVNAKIAMDLADRVVGRSLNHLRMLNGAEELTSEIEKCRDMISKQISALGRAINDFRAEPASSEIEVTLDGKHI